MMAEQSRRKALNEIEMSNRFPNDIASMTTIEAQVDTSDDPTKKDAASYIENYRAVQAARAIDRDVERYLRNSTENRFNQLKNAGSEIIDTRYDPKPLPLNGSDICDPARVQGGTTSVGGSFVFSREKLMRDNERINKMVYVPLSTVRRSV
jgi:hypothetical protein